jgi:hypothetical protein
MTDHALSNDAEAFIAQFIRCNFVALGRRLDRPRVKSMVLLLIQSIVAENFLLATILNLKCSSHFLNMFLRWHDLTFRRARAARRPDIDCEECAIFMIVLQKVARDFPEAKAMNFDESNWRPVMAGEQIVGKRGAGVVRNCITADRKANFSFFASICVNGTTFPFIVIAGGKTVRCNQQFGDQVPEPHQTWHSLRGWSTEDLMLDYLD